MDFEHMVVVMRDYQLDTFPHHVTLVCDRCNHEWRQRFDDGHSADELLIAAMSHYDKAHRVG